jgi:hypothetical protein
MAEPDDEISAPGTLYHYTNDDGLLGILQTGQLWATGIDFLNDAAELIYARDAVLGMIETRANELSPEFDEGPADTLRQTAQQFRSKSEFFLYVAALSEEGDSLSQWRAYGSYAIGFAGDQLVNLKPTRTVEADKDEEYPGLHVEKVSYGIEEARSSIDNALAQMSAPIGGFPGATGWLRMEEHLVPLLATIKHPSFSDESEWRVIVGETADWPSSRECFRVTRFGVAPYVKLSFLPEMVREVVIGPGRHAEVRASGVQRLLARLGYESAVVTVTDSPFRV